MSILGGENGFLESQYDILLFAFADEPVDLDIGLPGFSEGLRLQCDRNKYPYLPPGNNEGEWEYLTVYGFSGDVARLKEAVTQYEKRDNSVLWLYEAIAPLAQNAWQEEDREEHIFMALANAVAGREEDYSDWYNRRHIPDILSVSVYRSARRFRILAASGAGSPWMFLTFYRFVGPAGEMPGILHEAITQGDWEFSDAFDTSNAASWMYNAF
jgi:hypothetical protein